MQAFEVDGVSFEAIATRRTASTPTSFGIRKSAWMVDRYRTLAEEFANANVLELGIDQGASTALLALIMTPRRMLAVDLAPTPVAALDSFLQAHDLQSSIRTHWGVDQADDAVMNEVVVTTFGDEPLDLVIDDASHLLAPTKASFELLFPRIRPGGLFIIEDWSLDHEQERHMSDALRRNDDIARAVEQSIAARLDAGVEAPTPLSHLVTELVVASAHSPDVVAEVTARASWCEVRRGDASLDATFRIRDHLGSQGQTLVPPAGP